MRRFFLGLSRIGRAPYALAATALLAAVFVAPPALAFDLFATHEVTAQFATADGKPMANAEVRVFAPGETKTPVETGRTDAAGKFVFATDRDGMWSAEARTSGEVARIMVRVGGSSQHSKLTPVLMIGGLALLLVAAFWYRLRWLRPRPPKQ